MTGAAPVVALMVLLFAVAEGLAWLFAADVLKTFISRTPTTTLARIGLVQACIAVALAILVLTEMA